jgi:hypothetical protein
LSLLKYAVCKNLEPDDGEAPYEIRSFPRGWTVSEGPECGGDRTTVFKDAAGKEVADAWECLGVFDDMWEAKVVVARLTKVHEVMES